MSLYLMCLLNFVLCIIQDLDAEVNCEPNWFGPKLQFKCQCIDGCDSEGNCLKSSKCHSQWMDQACQYQSNILGIGVPKESDVESLYMVHDGDDSTCITNGELQSLVIDLSSYSLFSWMRLVVSDAALVDRFTLYFEDTSDVITKRLECWRQQITVVNIKTAYIRCDMNFPVNRIVLKGEGLASLCTIDVSKGRNLALKEKAEQTSTNGNNSASNAVDGNIESDVKKGSCTLTNNVTDLTPTWTLTLDEPAVVNVVNIYPPSYPLSEYLSNSILQTFDEYDVLILNTTIKYATVYPNVNKTPVKKVVIKATSTTSTTAVLSICELLLFGECPPGKWGLDCKKVCNDLCPENCNEIDGSCPTSCLGYFPPKCEQDCPPSKWGINCREDCPAACAYRYCNNINGECTAGCNGYSDPPFCTQACKRGYYGLNCLSYTTTYTADDPISCDNLAHEDSQHLCLHGTDSFTFSVSNFFIGFWIGVAVALAIGTVILLIRKIYLKRKLTPKTAQNVYEDLPKENLADVSVVLTNPVYDHSMINTTDDPGKSKTASYDEIVLEDTGTSHENI
uniref:Fucolectin tachylectin-4 pentraxin-1 domain-containing protein n=1 Tax=Biomphalaria glabrata TaxID=6526 RepID=A0A2C9JWF6_BIOGL